VKLRQLGSRIPIEYGGPYNPRDGTQIRNAKAQILSRIKRIDPSY
jgi:hypothetical protein